MNQETEDINYMRRCLQLAANGKQNARPNPMVGAVIVAEGRIIGEGYHVRCGEGHAEVNAFASVKAEYEHLLPQATIYVSLEPCSHYGKTPPCADLIIKKGVRRVVVGCIDPFAKVQGRGIKKLQEAGIDVTVGVLEEECKALNKRFFTANTARRPYITLKWAQSANGFIDDNFHPTMFSTPFTQMLAHKLRAESDAILVGRTTDERDHPQLNVRHWSGKDPKRIVLTHDTAITDLLANLQANHVQSLIVEGGAKTHKSFIEAGFWDEIRVETAPKTVATGTAAATLPSDVIVESRKSYDGNIITVYKRMATLLLLMVSVVAIAVGQRFVFPSTVKPLLRTQWAQDYPYNKLCPWETVDSTTHHSYAGCAPIVMAQVMNRYKYPVSSQTLGSTYDWELMFNTYSDSVTTAEEDAVARLIIDCGTSANTVYTQTASSTKLNDLITGLKKDFGYSPYMSIADRSYFPGSNGDKAWKDLIYKELKGGRPVIMRAERNENYAHVFIIDGCRDSTVHVNFGWGGKRNGYYDPDSLYGFATAQRMIVGIAPKGRQRQIIRRFTLSRAGQLASAIKPQDWLEMRHIKVIGPINRADIALLRQLAGGATTGGRSGNTATIDLSAAVILSLPDSAFYGCQNLTYITLPQTLPEISNSCFAACPKLNRVDFQHTVVSEIKQRAFKACFCLAEINFSNTLRTIGASAFNSCNSLYDISLPQSVTTIGNGAFAYSKRLHRLAIPRTAKNIAADIVKGTQVSKITTF